MKRNASKKKKKNRETLKKMDKSKRTIGEKKNIKKKEASKEYSPRRLEKMFFLQEMLQELVQQLHSKK